MAWVSTNTGRDSAMLATQQGCASWGGSGRTAAGVNGVHATALAACMCVSVASDALLGPVIT
jgi:hypothetical protein